MATVIELATEAHPNSPNVRVLTRGLGSIWWTANPIKDPPHFHWHECAQMAKAAHPDAKELKKRAAPGIEPGFPEPRARILTIGPSSR